MNLAGGATSINRVVQPCCRITLCDLSAYQSLQIICRSLDIPEPYWSEMLQASCPATGLNNSNVVVSKMSGGIWIYFNYMRIMWPLRCQLCLLSVISVSGIQEKCVSILWHKLCIRLSEFRRLVIRTDRECKWKQLNADMQPAYTRHIDWSIRYLGDIYYWDGTVYTFHHRIFALSITLSLNICRRWQNCRFWLWQHKNWAK